MEDVWKGMETTEREGLDNMDWTGIRLWETAEKTGMAEVEVGTG